MKSSTKNSRIHQYYRLTKPGIIRGNILTAAAGFFLASRGIIDVPLLLAMLGGLSLIIASACVFNNYIDRDIDKKMKRTKNRALVSGAISPRNALIFAYSLGVIGAYILFQFTNVLTALLALFGLFAYVVVYGIAKRQSSFGTIVGSVSGAIPPVVGYVAVTGQLNIPSYLLFFILTFWQMPHFYAIAIFRRADYSAADIPVLPIKSGIEAAKLQMALYIVGFIIVSSMLFWLDYVGLVYVLAVIPVSLLWLRLSIKGFGTLDTNLWARQMFLFSLLVISLWSVGIGIDSFIH